MTVDETTLKRLVRQVSNDGAIAYHLGIPVEEVAKARGQSSRELGRITTHEHGIDDQHFRGRTHWDESREIANASEHLRIAVNDAVGRFAGKERIRFDQAQALLLDRKMVA